MISVVLATYNEQSNIKRCLGAVKDFADEIIVVDGSSQDKTREIARELGARVIKTTNKPNFHINKQLAIDEAQGELILQLDADEVVDSRLAKFIEKTHQQLIDEEQSLEAVAWFLKRKNLFLGRWLKKGGQYPDPVIRLFIKDKAWLPQKDVHEQMEVDGLIGTAEGHLLHYANPSFSDYWRKFNTYTSFKAEQLKEQEVKLTGLNFLKFCVWLPTVTWFKLYIRHKGFMDGVAGLVFACFSGFHHAVAYLKLWELHQTSKVK